MNVRVLRSFTEDDNELNKALAKAAHEELGLSTHAFAAVEDAIRLFARNGRRTPSGELVKRVVILISDGFPTGDTVSPRTVIESANATNVNVFAVTVPSFSTSAKPLPTIIDLSGLIEETGGINAYATDKNYAEALKLIREDVLSRYLLAFYPVKEKRRDGNLHRLRIEVDKGLTVQQSRVTYLATGSK